MNKIFEELLFFIANARFNETVGEIHTSAYTVWIKKGGKVIIKFKNISCELIGENDLWTVKIGNEEKTYICIEEAVRECVRRSKK